MNLRNRLRAAGHLAVFCAVVVSIAVARPSVAQTLNASVQATFSGPVRLPGLILPAGTYTFKIVDRLGTMAAVFNKSHKLIAQIPVIAITRANPGPSVVLDSSSPDSHVAAWYADGQRSGYAFVYKKDAGLMMATETASPAAGATKG